MNYRPTLTKTVAIMTALSIAGCGSTGGTIALTAAGAAGAYVVGNTLATHSKLEIKVESFDARGLPIEDFEQHSVALLRHTSTEAMDVAVSPTMDGMRSVLLQLAPQMAELERLNDRLRSGPLASLEKFRDDLVKEIREQGEENPNTAARDNRDTEALATVNHAINDLQDLIDNNNRALNAWNRFKTEFETALTRNYLKGTLPALANHLALLRLELENRSGYRLSENAIGFLKLRLAAAALEMIILSGGNLADYTAQTTLQHSDDPGLSNEQRIATVLKVFAQEVTATLGPTRAPKESLYEPLSRALMYAGIAIRPEDIPDIDTLRTSDLHTIARHLQRSSIRFETMQLRNNAGKATFKSIGVDFNYGNIRNELLQVMLTPAAIDHITSRQNQSRWRSFSHAVSEGQAGNHDVIIYFEHLGLPIVKDAAFNPTQFQVANGLMFRRAFGALVDVVGVPLHSAGGDDQQISNPNGHNLIQARQSREQAIQKASQCQDAILEALKTIIAQAEQVTTGMPAENNQRLELQAQISDALQNAAIRVQVKRN